MTSGTVAFIDNRYSKSSFGNISNFVNEVNKGLDKDTKSVLGKKIDNKTTSISTKKTDFTKQDIERIVVKVVPNISGVFKKTLVEFLDSMSGGKKLSEKMIRGAIEQINELLPESEDLNDSQVKRLVGSVVREKTLSNLLASDKIQVANQYDWVKEFIKGNSNFLQSRLNYVKDSPIHTTQSAFNIFDNLFSSILARNKEVKSQIKSNKTAQEVGKIYKDEYNRISSLSVKTEKKKRFLGAYNTFIKHFGSGRSQGDTLKKYFITDKKSLRPDVYKEVIKNQRSTNQKIQNDINIINRYKKDAIPGEEVAIDLLLKDLKSAKGRYPLRTVERIKHDLKNNSLDYTYNDYYRTLYGEDPRMDFTYDKPGRLQKYNEYLAESIANVQYTYDNLHKDDDSKGGGIVSPKDGPGGKGGSSLSKRSFFGDAIGNTLMTGGSIASMVLPGVGPMLGGAGMLIKSNATSIARAGKFGRATAVGGIGSSLLAGALDGSYTMTGIASKFAGSLIKGAEWGIDHTLGNIPGVGGIISNVAEKGVDALIKTLPSGGNLLSEYISGTSIGTGDIIMSAINHGPAIAGGLLGSFIISGILSKGYNTLKGIKDFDVDTSFIKKLFKKRPGVIDVDVETVKEEDVPRLKGKGSVPLLSGDPWEDEDIPKFAKGGFIKDALFGLLGEAGPEVVLPLDGKVLGDLANRIVQSFYSQTKSKVESFRKTNAFSFGGVDFGKYFSKSGLGDISNKGLFSTIGKDLKQYIETSFERPLSIAKEVYGELKNFVVNFDIGDTIKNIKIFASDFKEGFMPSIEMAKEYFSIAKNYIKTGYDQDIRKLRKTFHRANNFIGRGLDVLVKKVDLFTKHIEKKDKRFYNFISSWIDKSNKKIQRTFRTFSSYFLSELDKFGKGINFALTDVFTKENIKKISDSARIQLKTSFDSFVNQSYNFGKGLYDRSQMAMAWVQTQRDIIRNQNYTSFGQGPVRERIKHFGRGFVDYIGEDTTFREYISKLTVLTGSVVEDLFVESRNMIRAGVSLIKGTSQDSSSHFIRFRKLAEDNFNVFRNQSSQLFTKFNRANERIGKAFGGRDNALKDVILKPIMFSLSKMVPGLGLGSGGILMGQRLADKDYRGANLELLSGLAGSMGLFPVSAAISVGTFLRDMNIKGGIKSLRGIDVEENIERFDPEAAADPGLAKGRVQSMRTKRLARESEIRTKALNTIAKATPYLGLIAGPLMSLRKLTRGDKFGAATELVSGITGGIGLSPVSVAMSAASVIPGAKETTKGILGGTDASLKVLLGPKYKEESAKALLKFGLKNIPIVGAVAGGVFAAQKLAKGDKFGAALEFIGGMAGGLGGPIAGSIIEGAIPFLEGLSTAIPGIIDNLAPFTQIFAPISSFWENIGGVGGIIGSIFQPLGFKALGEAFEYWEAFGGVLGNIGGSISTATNVFSHIIGDFSTTIVEGLDTGAKFITEKGLTFLSTLNTDFVKGFIKLGEAFSPMASFFNVTGLGAFANIAAPIRQFFIDPGDDPLGKRKPSVGTRIRNFFTRTDDSDQFVSREEARKSKKFPGFWKSLGINLDKGFNDLADEMEGKWKGGDRININLDDKIEIKGDLKTPKLEKQLELNLKPKKTEWIGNKLKDWWRNRDKTVLNLADQMKLKAEYDPKMSTVGLSGGLRRIPGLALGISGYHALRRAKRGDWEGARLEAAIGLSDHVGSGDGDSIRNQLQQRESQIAEQERKQKESGDKEEKKQTGILGKIKNNFLGKKEDENGDNKLIINTKGGDLNNVNLTQETGEGGVKTQDNDKSFVAQGAIPGLEAESVVDDLVDTVSFKKKKNQDKGKGDGGLLSTIGGAIIEGFAEEAAEGFFENMFKRGGRKRGFKSLMRGGRRKGGLAIGKGIRGIKNIGKGGFGIGKIAGMGGLMAGGVGLASSVGTGVKGLGSGIKGMNILGKGTSLLGKTGSMFGKIGKFAPKALKGLGIVGKKIPGLGLAIGGGLALSRLLQGDTTGAGLEIASGLAGTIPGFGTAASLGIDGALLARDIKGVDTSKSKLPTVVAGSKGMGLVSSLSSSTQDENSLTKRDKLMADETAKSIWGEVEHKTWWDKFLGWFDLGGDESTTDPGSKGMGSHGVTSNPYWAKKNSPEFVNIENSDYNPIPGNTTWNTEVNKVTDKLLDSDKSYFVNSDLQNLDNDQLGILWTNFMEGFLKHNLKESRAEYNSAMNADLNYAKNIGMIREKFDMTKVDGVFYQRGTDGKLYPKSDFVQSGNLIYHKDNSNILAKTTGDDFTGEGVHWGNYNDSSASNHYFGRALDLALGQDIHKPWAKNLRTALESFLGAKIIGPEDEKHLTHFDISPPRNRDELIETISIMSNYIPAHIQDKVFGDLGFSEIVSLDQQQQQHPMMHGNTLSQPIMAPTPSKSLVTAEEFEEREQTQTTSPVVIAPTVNNNVGGNSIPNVSVGPSMAPTRSGLYDIMPYDFQVMRLGLGV